MPHLYAKNFTQVFLLVLPRAHIKAEYTTIYQYLRCSTTYQEMYKMWLNIINVMY